MRSSPKVFFSVVALCFAASTSAAEPEPIEETPGAAKTLGYPTVAAALEGLRAMANVTVTVTKPDGWVIAVEQESRAIWSFAPSAHYAYPAVVRRNVQQRPGGEVYVQTVALCEADKLSCDKLIREFQKLNEKMGESVRARNQQNSGSK
jgi:hypothetical protein